MTIALINASPKGKLSTSLKLLGEVKKLLPQEIPTYQLMANREKLKEEDIEILKKSDIWLFANPLYIDSLPGHLLSILMQLEQECKQSHKVYAILNCGFFEATQNKSALRVYEHWCKKSGYEWCGGIGLGGGGAIAFIPEQVPLNAGPLKALGKAFVKLSDCIKNGYIIENTYVSFAVPRFLYLKMAHYSWKKEAKKNGLKPKDLYYKPY